jgi:hypothetical protein
MHANLELLLATLNVITLNVIMAIALMGLMLVHSIKNECPPNKDSAEGLPPLEL